MANIRGENEGGRRGIKRRAEMDDVTDGGLAYGLGGVTPGVTLSGRYTRLIEAGAGGGG